MKQMTKQSRSVRVLVSLVLSILSVLLLATDVYADDSNEVGYNIQAILPENQLDKEHTYFDLRMKPGQKQTIEVLINNTSDTKATYEVSVNQAYTNAQGFIDYTESKNPDEKDLPYKIDDLLSYEKEVTVDANKSVKYPIEIQMPEKEFDGQIMAGIRVMKKQEDSGDGIKNKVGYVLGINLTETDNAIKRNLELVSVKPAASFGKTSVVATVKNPTMEAYGKLKYVVNVTNSATGKNVRSITYDSGMQLAPNSTYGLAIDWENKRLEAGDYQLNLVVTDAQNNKWTFDEKFTITKKQANDINNITVDKDKETGWPLWAYLLLIGGIILVIGIVVFFLMKRNKKKKEEERKRLAAMKKKKNRKRKPKPTTRSSDQSKKSQ